MCDNTHYAFPYSNAHNKNTHAQTTRDVGLRALAIVFLVRRNDTHAYMFAPATLQYVRTHTNMFIKRTHSRMIHKHTTHNSRVLTFFSSTIHFALIDL